MNRPIGACLPFALLFGKRGDCYLRTLLIHGARVVVYHAQKKFKPDHTSLWVNNVVQRRNKNVVAVALANKNARTIWALLAHDRRYKVDHQLQASAPM